MGEKVNGKGEEITEGKGKIGHTKLRQRETSCDVSRHQDTVEMERVSSNRSAHESDTVGTGEN